MTPRLGVIILTAAFSASCGERRPIDAQLIEPSAEAPAENAPFYIGVWAADAGLCASEPGSGDSAPIEITTEEFISQENRCRIMERQEGTEAGWRLSLTCIADGVETAHTIDVDVDGHMLRVKRPDAPETAFVRCVRD